MFEVVLHAVTETSDGMDLYVKSAGCWHRGMITLPCCFLFVL